MRWIGKLFFFGSLAVLALLVATCVSAPMRWLVKPESPWRVRVLDKTVPHEDFREHAALFWVLRHEKVATPQGDRSWSLDRDYVGFYPVADPADENVRGHGRLLSARDLQGADLLFVADTYGVYTGDYARGDRVDGDYSRRLFGGLEPAEVDLIEGFIGAGGAVVAEFNTFASPTVGDTRRRLEELFGLRWSGWTGRYFRDLSDTNEVPPWAPRLWRRQQEVDWRFRGPGYLLVHEDGRLFVLREGVDVERPGLTIAASAGHPLVAGTLDGVRFNYWFDLVTPTRGTRVAATFRFHAAAPGRALLAAHGVPAEFPALLVAGGSPLRVYMAGDFSDAGVGLGPWWAEGLPWLAKTMMRVWFPRKAEHEPFYWGFYIPVLRNLLHRYAP